MFYEQVDDTRAQRFKVSSQYVASGQLRMNMPSGAHVTNWLQDVQAWKSPSDGQAVNIDTQVPTKQDVKIYKSLPKLFHGWFSIISTLENSFHSICYK